MPVQRFSPGPLPQAEQDTSGLRSFRLDADVQALTAAGLLDPTEEGLRADYDAIETKIAI